MTEIQTVSIYLFVAGLQIGGALTRSARRKLEKEQREDDNSSTTADPYGLILPPGQRF